MVECGVVYCNVHTHTHALVFALCVRVHVPTRAFAQSPFHNRTDSVMVESLTSTCVCVCVRETYVHAPTDIPAAPLWDSIARQFVGLLSVTDFIDILRQCNRRGIPMDELSARTIAEVMADVECRKFQHSTFLGTHPHGRVFCACVACVSRVVAVASCCVLVSVCANVRGGRYGRGAPHYQRRGHAAAAWTPLPATGAPERVARGLNRKPLRHPQVSGLAF